MNKKRFIVELGTGIEIHGQDMTRAAIKAIRDAMSRLCVGLGLGELFNLTGHDDIILEVLIACPRPEEVKVEEVKKVLLSSQNEVKVVPGGMLARGHIDPVYKDKSDEIIVVNAAITVLVDIDKVKLEQMCF